MTEIQTFKVGDLVKVEKTLTLTSINSVDQIKNVNPELEPDILKIEEQDRVLDRILDLKVVIENSCLMITKIVHCDKSTETKYNFGVHWQQHAEARKNNTECSAASITFMLSDGTLARGYFMQPEEFITVI